MFLFARRFTTDIVDLGNGSDALPGVMIWRPPTLHYSIASLCGKNMVRHLQAPPALMNSDIGNS